MSDEDRIKKKVNKKIREASGASIAEGELKEIKKSALNEVLREELGAMITSGELKSLKKSLGMKKGGSARKSANNSGLFGRK